MVRKITRSSVALWLSVFVLVVAIVSMLIPPTHWLEVDVHVPNQTAGDEIVLQVRRVIRRDFFARWTVTVRETYNGNLVVATATGAGAYSPGADLPLPTTLEWWTGGAHASVDEPGNYVIETFWEIVPRFFPFIVKRYRVDSNAFRVLPGKGGF